MTLKQKLYEALKPADVGEKELEAAAEVCKGYIERAYKKGCAKSYFIEESYENWLKSEGITE